MTRHYAEAKAHTAADPATVYSLLSDGTTWPSWIFVNSMELEREGADGGDSVGAIRVYRFQIAGLKSCSREQVVELVPDRRFSYRVLTGIPIKDHRADVDLTPVAGGTDITWSATWRPKIPGSGLILKIAIDRIYRSFSAGLAARAAEVRTS